MIERAFDQWPESADFQPASSEELRKWLQAKCGHMKFVEIELSTDAAESAADILKAMRTMGQYAWHAVKNGKLLIVVPDSIAFDKMKHQEFCRLNDEVAALIERIIGVPVDELMKETA